jgi:CPA2 family monovalent cation:H+ antiporter-2
MLLTQDLAPHLAPLIHDLAIILGVAGIVSVICQRIHQPVVVGYIAAGLIVGPHTPPFPLVTDLDGIRLWAELGVIFLMFSLGLEFSFRKLTKIGFSAGIVTVLEVGLMTILGYGVGKILNYPEMDCVFLGSLLCISSTTIIIKALDELKLKSTDISDFILSLLIVEDLVAILVLVLLNTFVSHDAISGAILLRAVGKLILVIGGWFLCGYFFVPRFISYVGKVGTWETLTVTSLGLCLLLVVFSSYLQYSPALGAFIMGSLLAESSEANRIYSRIEPLKDLFSAVFFVSIGMLLDPHIMWEHKGTILLLSTVVICGKAIGVTISSLLTGQPLRIAIPVGFSMGQIGEFSFIIATLGITLDVIQKSLYPIVVAVSVLTTLFTPYSIRFSQNLAHRIESQLPKKWNRFLTRYSLGTKDFFSGAVQGEFFKHCFRWGINGIATSIVFILSSRLFVPWIQIHWTSHAMKAAGMGWFIAATVSSPSILAMFITFKKFSSLEHKKGAHFFLLKLDILLFFRLLTVVWLGFLGLSFFPVRYVILSIATFVIVFFTLFYRHIEVSYHWFERQFEHIFEESNKSDDSH